jgi:putative hydrolase
MSDDGPFGDDAMPFPPEMFAELMRMMQATGPISWDTAKQLASTIATQGTSESNVDPSDRMAIDELARVADLHVQNATGLSTIVDGRPPTIAAVNRSTWAMRTLDTYRPLLETLGESIARVSRESMPPSDELIDPSLAWLTPLMRALNPMLLGLTAGSMVGHLASRTLGTYDLPVPRRPNNEVMIVVPNLDGFGNDWSLPKDELRLWICVHELAHHAVLSLPHVHERITSLLQQHAAAFTADHSELQERLGDIDITSLMQGQGADSLEDLQRLIGDPEVVLGAVQSPQQRALLPHLEAVICAVVGYVDHTMDSIGAHLISSYRMLTEALRRRRVEADTSDRFVEKILGFNLTQQQYDRGRHFIDGIIERSGPDALPQLWESARTLPTPAEIDAPGLWLARIEIPD